MTDQLFTGSYPSDALTEAKQLRAENERLRALVRKAYFEGWARAAHYGASIIGMVEEQRDDDWQNLSASFVALQKQEGGE